jgi:hypothetical protein
MNHKGMTRGEASAEKREKSVEQKSLLHKKE